MVKIGMDVIFSQVVGNFVRFFPAANVNNACTRNIFTYLQQSGKFIFFFQDNIGEILALETFLQVWSEMNSTGAEGRKAGA